MKRAPRRAPSTPTDPGLVVRAGLVAGALLLLVAAAAGCGAPDPAAEPDRTTPMEAGARSTRMEGGGTRGRRERAERARQEAWELFLALLEDGRAEEALRVLAALRDADPDFLDDDEKQAAIARLVRALLASLESAADPGALAAELGRRLGDAAGAAALAAEAKAIAARRESLTQRDRLAIARHVERFHKGESLATGDWVDQKLARLADAPPKLLKQAKPLPVPDPEATQKRRDRQLVKLQERKVVPLLDHIHGALAWLAIHQGDDGAFSTKRSRERCKALGHKPQCIRGGGEFPLATTALAALAFLDFRDQDATGLFESSLANAVQWLLAQQKQDGGFKGRYSYSTPIAVMALGQAASSSGREDVRVAAGRGLAFLYASRGPGGGHRYRPGDPGDLSVTGWVGQALEAVEAAGVESPQGMRTLLAGFHDSVWQGQERFTYVANKGERVSLFPAGMLLRLVLDPELDDATRKSWKNHLKAPPRRADVLYHHYYAVRVLLALEGDLPDAWREHLLKMAAEQVVTGNASGVWRNSKRTRWFSRGGEVLVTAAYALTLEHALYRR